MSTPPAVQTAPSKGKPWYQSKTIWVNVAWPMAVWLVQQVAGGHLPVDAKTAAVLQSAANIILRILTVLPIKPS